MIPFDLHRRDPGLPRFTLAVAALALAGAAWLLLRPAARPLAGLAEVATAVAATPAVGSAADQSGATVFLDQGCGGCHATSGAATARGPSLAGAGARAAERVQAPDYRGGAGSARDHLRESVIDHCADVTPGYACEQMPELGLRIGTADLDALVGFLMRLPPEGSP